MKLVNFFIQKTDSKMTIIKIVTQNCFSIFFLKIVFLCILTSSKT